MDQNKKYNAIVITDLISSTGSSLHTYLHEQRSQNNEPSRLQRSHRGEMRRLICRICARCHRIDPSLSPLCFDRQKSQKLIIRSRPKANELMSCKVLCNKLVLLDQRRSALTITEKPRAGALPYLLSEQLQ